MIPLIDQFKNRLEKEGVSVTIDAPLTVDGVWWFELRRNVEDDDYFEEIEYTVERGFAFYPEVMACGFGESPTDITNDADVAISLARERIKIMRRW